MVHARANDGQAQGDIHRLAEARKLEYRQSLVVIHRKHGIVRIKDGRYKRRIGGQRAGQSETCLA